MAVQSRILQHAKYSGGCELTFRRTKQPRKPRLGNSTQEQSCEISGLDGISKSSYNRDAGSIWPYILAPNLEDIWKL